MAKSDEEAVYAKENSTKSVLSVDQFLQNVGEMRKFQIIVLAVCSFLFIIPTHVNLCMVFVAASPPWRCSGVNVTECKINKTFYEGDDGFNLRCHMNRSSWEYVIEKSSYSIVSEFNLVCSRKYLAYLANSALYFGIGVGSPFLGLMSDKYGRQKVLFSSYFIECLLGFAISYSPNIYVFIVLNFTCGIANGGVLLGLSVIPMELVGPKYRAFAGLVVWELSSAAACLLSLQSYYIPDWRHLKRIISIPYIILTIGFLFVPESLRWLRSKNKLKEAETILKKIARINKRNYPDNATIQPIQISEMESSGTFRDLFTSWRVTVQLFIACFLCFTVDGSYYALLLAFSGFGGSLHRDFVLMILPELFTNIFGIFMADRFGRKSSSIVGFVCSAIGLMTVGVLTIKNIKVNSVNITIGVFIKIFSMLASCGVEIWTTELFPTCVRSKALGILCVSSTIGMATAPWISKALVIVHPSAPFFVLGGIPILASLLALTIPETKGMIMHDFIENENENTT